MIVGACKIPSGFNILIEPKGQVQCKVLGDPQTISKTTDEQWTNDMDDDYDGKNFKVCNKYTETNFMSKTRTISQTSAESWSSGKETNWAVEVSPSFEE